MFPSHVLLNVGLLLRQHTAVRALEPWRKTALVPQMTLQTFDHHVALATLQTLVISGATSSVFALLDFRNGR